MNESATTDAITSTKFPRINRESLAEPLASELAAIEKRLGYLNEIFLLQGHVPASISAFLAYTQSVKAPLTDRLNQLVALTACSALDAPAELIQHERLAVRLGMSKEFVATAEGRPGSDGTALTLQEHQVRQVVLQVIANLGRGSEPALAALSQTLGAEQAMAVLLQTTRFLLVAVLYRTFSLTVPVASIFDEVQP
jgi:hypothetical protein